MVIADREGATGYVRPTHLADALRAIGRSGAIVIAGGQNLIPRLTTGAISPTWLVDLGAIAELRDILCGPYVQIGAMVSLTSLIESSALAEICPLLGQCAARTATPTVRNRATLIGNLVVADPASQLPTAIIALGAFLLIQRSEGRGPFRRSQKRWVEADQFFLGPNRSMTGPDEIVTHVRIPNPPPQCGHAVIDVAPRRNSRPLATASALAAVDGDDRISFMRLAISGCGDVPRRCRSIETALLGERAETAPVLAQSLLNESPPPAGKGVLDADYAMMVLPVLARRALEAALRSARPKVTVQ